MGNESEGRPGRSRAGGHPRIAIAGSRILPGRAALPIISFVLKFKHPVVLLRSGLTAQNNRFEFACSLACKQLDVPVEWFEPKPGGRDEVFFRDIEMVSEADVVLCVFPEDKPMEGGTAHIVEKAQDRRVPVYAYTNSLDSSRWQRLGEWDPDDAWARLVPAG